MAGVIGFCLGFICGGVFGVMTLALLKAARDGDDLNDRH